MPQHLTRRIVLKLGAGAALSVPFARANAAEGDVTLCGIFSQTGHTRSLAGTRTVGSSSLSSKPAVRRWATISATSFATIKPIRESACNRSSDAIDDENAKYFVGVASSSVGLAIEQVCGMKHAMFLTSVGAEP